MPFFWAISQNGKLITADDAIGGINYYCPHCHAAMHVRKCITRTSHYFIFNDYHKSKDCKEIEKDQKVIRMPALLNSNKFSSTIMNPKIHATGRNKRKENSGKARSSGRELRPPNCIRQLIVSGVREMDPNMQIENGKLSDVYIGPKSYCKCLQKDTSLDFRILDLWLNSALDGRIRYVARWNYRGHKFRAFFEHHVDESLNFEALADELFAQRSYYYGHTLWTKPRYKSIAVAGEWIAKDRNFCQRICNFCENARSSCFGMWVAQLKHIDQIYYSDLPNNRFDR